MGKNTIYYVDTDRGCTLYSAPDMERAKCRALYDAGHFGFKSIREATETDVAWFRSMGGRIHTVGETA